MSTTLETGSRLNGHDFLVKGKSKKVRARKALTISSTQASNLGKYITIAMGVGIPLLSLSLSSLGGSLLAAGQWGLGSAALALCVCVLGVSLSHLAWAVGNISKSAPWANWLLAIACDASLVLSELAGVFAHDADIHYLRLVLMVAVTLASMVLNCWAFLAHKPANTGAKR